MADGCLVDTDVLSYLFHGDTRAEAFRAYLTGRIPAISFMSVAELDRWALQRNWGTVRQQRMNEFLGRFVVVLANRGLCRRWAEVCQQARRNGRPIQTADAWVAAAARSLDVPLLTNNRGDYAGSRN